MGCHQLMTTSKNRLSFSAKKRDFDVGDFLFCTAKTQSAQRIMMLCQEAIAVLCTATLLFFASSAPLL